MIKAGYVWAHALQEVTDADASMLNQINLAFGLVKDGILSFGPRDEKVFSDAMDRIRSVNPAMKITLSVGGWGAGGFSDMAMTDAGRRAFAASCQSSSITECTYNAAKAGSWKKIGYYHSGYDDSVVYAYELDPK